MAGRNSSEYPERGNTEDYDDSPSEESTKFPSQHEPDYNKRLMEWISENNDSNGNEALENVIKQKMVHTAHQTQTYQEKRAERYLEAHETYHSHHQNIHQLMAPDTTINASRDMIHDSLLDAAEKNDLIYFQEILDSIPERDAELSEQIRLNTGFTTLADAHAPSHDLEFTNTSQAVDYAQRMNQMAENYNTPDYFPNEDIRNAVQHQVEELNARLATAVESDRRFEERQQSGAAHPWEEWNSAHLNDVASVAQALNYMTRPKDDLFWKMVDSENEASTDLMLQQAINEKNKSVYQAVADVHPDNAKDTEMALAANAALTLIHQAHLKSDVLQEDHASYLQHLNHIERLSEHFGKTLLGDGGFIISEGYQEQPFPEAEHDIQHYLITISDQLQSLQASGQIHPDHHEAVSSMIDRYQESKYDLLPTLYRQGKDEPAKRLLEWQDRTLRGIGFLMRPEHNT